MNRRERRAHRIGNAWPANVVEALTRCSDCASETTYARDEYGILHATIAHDDTCPTYRRMRGRR